MSVAQDPEFVNEQQLLLQTADGDPKSFSHIYDLYKKAVFHLAMAYLQDREEAVEITQQVFIYFWERRARLAGVNSLKEYILTSARNAVFDHLKQLGRQARLISNIKGRPLPFEADSNEVLEEKMLTGIWLEIVGQLPERQKQVYQFIEIEGMNLEQVAGITALSKATVKKHIELARKYVRNEMRMRLANRGVSSNLPGARLFSLLFL